MWTAIGIICIFGLLLTAVIFAVKEATKKQAELEHLLELAEERKNASKIIDSVRNMADADVRGRLQDTKDN